MFTFWIAAAVLSALAAGLILRRAAGLRFAHDPARDLYKRQLGELDELSRQGLLADNERRAAHAEAARRLLIEAGEDAPQAAGKGGRLAVIAAAAAAPLAALAVYLTVGSPQLPDQPFARRVAVWRAADPAALSPLAAAAVLEAVSRERPTDPEPLRNMALAQQAAGETAAAQTSLRKAIALAPQRADLWSALGELFTLQAQGEVDDDARAAFRQALNRDRRDAAARYYLARDLVVRGQTAQGLADWRALLADLAPTDPRRAALQADIAAVQRTGKPAQAVVADAAAGGVDIQAMVDGLAARLAAQPNDPQGWVRLVRAYSVLGDGARRDAALKQARRLFDDPQIRQALDDAAAAP